MVSVNFLPSISRATGIGVMAGLVALLSWLLMWSWPRIFVVPHVTALVVTLAAGGYILLATFYDHYRNPRRGVRIRPIRAFDIVSGLILAVPATWALWPYLPAL